MRRPSKRGTGQRTGSTSLYVCYKEPNLLTSAMRSWGRTIIPMKIKRRHKNFFKKKKWVEKHGQTNQLILTNNIGEDLQSSTASIAIIYKSELDYISRCILDCTNIETGGQLFGFWTADKVPVVLYAIGPGPHANHQVTFFNQDVDYLTRVGRPIVKRFGLQHIGEWHSHHQMGLAQPSGHDANTMLSTIRDKHLVQFLLCIGNCTNTSSTLNAFNFSEFSQNYVKAQWCIKEIESPFRQLIDNELAPFLFHPRTLQGNMENVYTTESQQNLPPEYKDSYWFSIKENRQILKQIMDTLGNCTIQQDKEGYVYLTKVDNGCVDVIFFPEGFPHQSPRLKRRYPNNSISELNVAWNYQGNLYNDFINYYKQTIGL